MGYSVIQLSGDAEAQTQAINAATAEGYKLITVAAGYAYLEEIAE